MIIASRSWNELLGRSWTLFSHPKLFLRKITLACLRYGGHIKCPTYQLPTYQPEANVMALGFLCVCFFFQLALWTKQLVWEQSYKTEREDHPPIWH